MKQELLDEIDRLYDKIADRDQTIEDLEKRVEELEDYIRQHVGVTWPAGYRRITDEQIDAAWKLMLYPYIDCNPDEIVKDVLEELNIVRCKECCCTECWGSTGDHHTHGPLGIEYIDTCDECNGHGWVVKDE